MIQKWLSVLGGPSLTLNNISHLASPTGTYWFNKVPPLRKSGSRLPSWTQKAGSACTMLTPNVWKIVNPKNALKFFFNKTMWHCRQESLFPLDSCQRNSLRNYTYPNHPQRMKTSLALVVTITHKHKSPQLLWPSTKCKVVPVVFRKSARISEHWIHRLFSVDSMARFQPLNTSKPQSKSQN